MRAGLTLIDVRVGHATTSWSVDLRPGSLHLLWGPSGCGKSSLLRALAGTLQPSLSAQGTVTVDRGRAFDLAHTAHTPGALHPVVAWLPQSPMGLLQGPAWTMRQWTDALGLDVTRLTELGMQPEALARAVTTWSGGEQQRAVFAAVLAQTPAPQVVLLDEPTAALDGARVAQVATLIQTAQSRGLAVLVATHDPRLLAALTGPMTWWAVSHAGVTPGAAAPHAASGDPAPVTRRAESEHSSGGDAAGGGPAAWAELHERRLTVRAGELVALIGPSGAGKTTWATRLVGGPRAARVGGTRGGVALGWLTQDVRLLFPARWPQRRIAEEIAHAQGAAVAAHYTALAQEFGVARDPDRVIAAHSVGELQRLGLARLIATAPTGGVADEPTSAVDQTARAAMTAALRAWARRGAAVVVATHDPDLMAAADRQIDVSAL